MDVRVKVGKAGNLIPDRQEILTGLGDRSLKSLFHTLASRHPDLGKLLDAKPKPADVDVYVNNSQVPTQRRDDYFLHDGDTVSLMLK